MIGLAYVGGFSCLTSMTGAVTTKHEKYCTEKEPWLFSDDFVPLYKPKNEERP